MHAAAVESPTEISRDFICNVTSSAWDYLGQDGWLERSGDGASLGQEYGAVSGGIGLLSLMISFLFIVRTFPLVRAGRIFFDDGLNSVYVYLPWPCKLIFRWNS